MTVIIITLFYIILQIPTVVQYLLVKTVQISDMRFCSQELVDIDLFRVSRQVEAALENKDSGPCLAWCYENRSKLRKIKVRCLNVVFPYSRNTPVFHGWVCHWLPDPGISNRVFGDTCNFVFNTIETNPIVTKLNLQLLWWLTGIVCQSHNMLAMLLFSELVMMLTWEHCVYNHYYTAVLITFFLCVLCCIMHIVSVSLQIWHVRITVGPDEDNFHLLHVDKLVSQQAYTFFNRFVFYFWSSDWAISGTGTLDGTWAVISLLFNYLEMYSLL